MRFSFFQNLLIHNISLHNHPLTPNVILCQLEILNFFIITLIISIIILILATFTVKILNDIHNFKFGKQFSSKNIIYEKKSVKHREFNAKMGLIIINANYDSIGRRIPGFTNSKLQKALLIITRVSYIITVLTSFIGILKLHPNVVLIFKIFTIIGLMVSIITSIIYFINYIENTSNGAVDNASGCAVLLNLIQMIHEGKIDLNWMDLQFLFSGAKKIGTWGTNSFLKTMYSEFINILRANLSISSFISSGVVTNLISLINRVNFNLFACCSLKKVRLFNCSLLSGTGILILKRKLIV